jgi:hypothetical protein
MARICPTNCPVWKFSITLKAVELNLGGSLTSSMRMTTFTTSVRPPASVAMTHTSYSFGWTS